MARRSRKKSHLRENYVTSEEIESSEESDDSPSLSMKSLDDNIEEDEEPDIGIPSSGGSYPPLVIKKLRSKSRSSVDQERTVDMAGRTVLYGQTPKAVCRKQFKEMAAFQGMSVQEFAKQITAESAAEKLVFLRSFYTFKKPDLTPLFECVEESLHPSGKNSSRKQDQPSSSTVIKESDGVSTLQNENSVSLEDKQSERVDSCPSEVVYDRYESESFSHLATSYAEKATLPIYSSGPSCSGISNRGKRTEVNQDEISMKKLCRTVISETESDSDEGTSSPSSRTTKQKSPHLIQANNKFRGECSTRDVNDECFTSNKLLRESSIPPSNISNVFDRLLGSKSLKYSYEAVSDNNDDLTESKDYNKVLDGLLFDRPAKPLTRMTLRNGNENDSRTVRTRDLTLKGEASGSKPRFKDKNKAAHKSLTKCNQITVVDQCSGSYNRVLDNLLFGGNGSSESLGRVEKNTKNTTTTTFLSQHHNSAEAGPSTSKNMFSKTVSKCLSNRHNEDDSPSSEKLESSDKENVVHVLPSSLELSESLWNNLDDV